MDDLIRRLDSAAGGDVGEYWSDLFAEAKDEIVRLRAEAEEINGIMTERSAAAMQAEFDADCWVNVLEYDRDEMSGWWFVRDGLIRDTIATLRAAANQIDRLTRNSERT